MRWFDSGYLIEAGAVGVKFEVGRPTAKLKPVAFIFEVARSSVYGSSCGTDRQRNSRIAMIQVDAKRFAEHLPYEINMLKGTYAATARVPGWIGNQVVENALIESFCIHARALFEFFSKEGGRHTYTDDKYHDLGGHDNFREILNNQIAHVIHDKRTRDESKKIGSEVRFEMFAALRLELEHFKKHLVPGYSANGLPDIPVYLAAATMKSATNAVQMSTVSVSYNPAIASPQVFQLVIPKNT